MEGAGMVAPAGMAGRAGVWEAQGALEAWAPVGGGGDCMCIQGFYKGRHAGNC